MGTLSFHPFTFSDAEYELLAATNNETNGHRYPISAENIKWYDSIRDEDYLLERYIVRDGAEGVGVVPIFQMAWSFHPQKYNFGMHVKKSYQNNDSYDQTWAFVQEQLGDKDLIAYCTSANEYEIVLSAYLQAQGFQEVMRYPASELVIADFDFAKFASVVEKVKASGIEIISVEELQTRDADWLDKIWRLEAALIKDVPTPDETQDLPLDEYTQQIEGNPRWDMSQMLIAMDGAEAVGLTRAIVPQHGLNRFGTGMTGVLRSHRRRGIALALKVASMRKIADVGGEIIEANNEENNPMYQINMKLGFQPIEASVDYELAIQD